MPPVSQAQRRWAWANKDKKGPEGRAAKEYADADPGGKLPEKVMNPVMHTHHPMEGEVKNETEFEGHKSPPQKREMFSTGRKGIHATFKNKGPAYLKKGAGEARRFNQGGTTPDGDRASYEHEANEAGTENLKENLGSKRKSGHGEPQGGTTTVPNMGAPHEDLKDETRGTKELPSAQYAGKKVPQEAKERIAKALLRARR